MSRGSGRQAAGALEVVVVVRRAVLVGEVVLGVLQAAVHGRQRAIRG